MRNLKNLKTELAPLEHIVREQIAKYNKDNPSEYWKLTDSSGYRYRHYEKGLRLALEESYSLRPLLEQSILIAQLGVEDVDGMFEHLEKEVAI